MDSSELARILESDMTVSDKIRALAAAGYARAEIARVLGKRYQHVRNVLEADRLHPRRQPVRPEASPAGLAEPPQPFGGVHRLLVEPGGVVRLPREVMVALGGRSGGVLIGELEADRFVILSVKAAWEKAAGLVRSMGIPSDRLLSEELIAERRAEAAREEQDD